MISKKYEYLEKELKKMTSISDIFEVRFRTDQITLVNEKDDYVDPKSLYLFTLDNRVRRFCRFLIEWRPFEWFIMVMIILNSIILSIIGMLI